MPHRRVGYGRRVMRYMDELAKRIAALPGAHVIGEVGPKKDRFPLFRIARGEGKKVLLMAGVHGDEPAGPVSFIEFFEREARHYERHFEFTAFPCVNPWGFEHYFRENSAGININR